MTARIIQIIKKPNRNRDKLPDTESLWQRRSLWGHHGHKTCSEKRFVIVRLRCESLFS